MIIAYINSETLLNSIEGIMGYEKFQVCESNKSFRVFTGFIAEPVIICFKKLFTQLNDFDFDIEDSMFIAYPSFKKNNSRSVSTLVLKRKGNKHLRRLEYR
jgi:hypothetical protein